MSSRVAGSVLPAASTEADLVLEEYTESEPRELSERALDFLVTEVNGGSKREGERIELRFTRDGLATLRATAYVGIVSLPNGPTIEIRPKAQGNELLTLLRYANGVEGTTFDEEADVEAGDVFIEAIAALFESELSDVLDRGLHTQYRETQATEQQLRGRLDLQRQLQRQPPKATEFECTYDELTPDIIINHAVLFATTVLLRLTEDPTLLAALERHQQRLQRRVTLRPVTPAELRTIELNRLNNYYEDLFRFTRMVINNLYISELTAGRSAAYSLLVNMNTVFENVVTRAASEAIAERPGWEVVEQDRSKSLVTGGRRSVTLQPDFTVRDGSGTTQIVGDAKWKTDDPSNADFYQLTAYGVAHNSPGLLVYPEQGGSMEDDYTLATQQRLSLIELPTASNTGDLTAFETGLKRRISEGLNELVQS